MRCLAVAAAVIALMAGAVHAQDHRRDETNARGGGQGSVVRGETAPGSSAAQSMRGPGHRGNGNTMREPRGNPERAGGGAHPAEHHPGRAGRGDREPVMRPGQLGFDAPRAIDGCPPGLARKRNGCQPPGLARRHAWSAAFDRPEFWGITRPGDDRYFYDDGYLMRYTPSGGVLSYVPLLGGALSIGNAWPEFYQPVELPGYYERYYGLGPNESYRYADDVIYRIDPETSAIGSIVALLTGDAFAVGEPLPPGYDIYNVPYGFRDRYVDGPAARYRYADGYIYQVDPGTRLIASAIELLAS